MHLAVHISDKKIRDQLKEKVSSVKCEVELNETSRKARETSMSTMNNDADALAQMLAGGQEFNEASRNEPVSELEIVEARECFEKNKVIVTDKGQHKDW